MLSSRNIILCIVVYLNLPMFPFWEHALYPRKHKNGLKQLLSFINGYFAATEKKITLFASQDICAVSKGIIQIWRRGQHIEKIEYKMKCQNQINFLLLFLLNLTEPCDMTWFQITKNVLTSLKYFLPNLISILSTLFHY